MATLLRLQPSRVVLDVGCGPATLKGVLGEDFTYYGCDIADVASDTLGAAYFQQIDFNASPEAAGLQVFSDRGVGAVNISGVLEYLDDPGALLRAAHALVAPTEGRLVVSIINFAGLRRADLAGHHPAWIYKPTLLELEALLAETGWEITGRHAYFGHAGWKEKRKVRSAARRGMNDVWTQREARQFLIEAVV